MTPQNWLEFAIDWMGLPALAVLAGILVYRRWYRHFPLFVLYVIGAEVVGVVRLIFMHAPRNIYSQVYWSTDTATAAFAFLATYELFFKRLFPGFYKTRLYRVLFPAIAILITVLVAHHGAHWRASTALPTATRVYEFLARFVLVFFVGSCC